MPWTPSVRDPQTVPNSFKKDLVHISHESSTWRNYIETKITLFIPLYLSLNFCHGKYPSALNCKYEEDNSHLVSFDACQIWYMQLCHIAVILCLHDV